MNIAKTLQRVLLKRDLEEALTLNTLAEFEVFVSRLSQFKRFQLASLIAPTAELQLIPGWHFGVAEINPADKYTMLRMSIWQYCRQHRLQRPVTLPWYNKLRVHAYLGNDSSRLLFIDGNYEPNEFVFLASILTPGMVFLDIGANDGLYSIFAAQCVTEEGHVMAFEPSQREFSRLQANLMLNYISNVTPFRLALYNINGSKTFQIAGYEHEGQNTIGEFIYEGIALARTETVPVRRLDDIATEEGWERIDVIKMDVEGAEQAILEGAQRLLNEQKPVLLLELSDTALKKQGSSANDTLKFLRHLGYYIYAFSDTTGMLKAVSEDTKLSPNIVASPSAHLGSLV